MKAACYFDADNTEYKKISISNTIKSFNRI